MGTRTVIVLSLVGAISSAGTAAACEKHRHAKQVKSVSPDELALWRESGDVVIVDVNNPATRLVDDHFRGAPDGMVEAKPALDSELVEAIQGRQAIAEEDAGEVLAENVRHALVPAVELNGVDGDVRVREDVEPGREPSDAHPVSSLWTSPLFLSG